MLIEFKFTSQDGQEIEGMRTELDRNYDDEETALVFIHNDESDTGGYFELNLRKDEQGHFTGGGYVCEYDCEEDSEPAYINTDIELEVIEHDFDETLAKANEQLKPFGKRIVVDYDGEGYWAVGSTDMDGGNPDYYVDADFEHEVQAHIWECLAHVLAKVKKREPMKLGLYKVSNTLGFDRHTFDAYEPKAIEDALQPLLNDDNEAAIINLEDRESVELFVEELNNQEYDGYWAVLIQSYENNE